MALDRSERQLHRIGSLRFEVSGPREDQLSDLRAQLFELSQSALPAVLSQSFDAVAGENETVSIDRLEIDLGRIDPGRDIDLNHLAQELLARLRNLPPAAKDAQHDPADPSAADTPSVRREQTQVARAKSFATYLRTGQLDAFAPEIDFRALRDTLLSQPIEEVAARKIADALALNPVATRRLAHICSDLQIMILLQSLKLVLQTPQIETLDRMIAAWVAPKSISQFLRNEPGHLHQLLSHPNAGTTAAPKALGTENHDPQNAAVEEAAQDLGTPKQKPRPRTSVPMQAAGSVLIAPFLPQFFNALALDPVEGDIMHCAQAVHTLVYGKEGDIEPDLTFTRVFLPAAEDAFLIPDAPLPEAVHGEAEKLLEAAIAYWSKLGNTSPEGLRETFLHRPGLIEYGSKGARIKVETRGVDVLLASVPWSFSPLRLPWLERPIMVEWA